MAERSVLFGFFRWDGQMLESKDGRNERCHYSLWRRARSGRQGDQSFLNPKITKSCRHAECLSHFIRIKAQFSLSALKKESFTNARQRILPNILAAGRRTAWPLAPSSGIHSTKTSSSLLPTIGWSKSGARTVKLLFFLLTFKVLLEIFPGRSSRQLLLALWHRMASVSFMISISTNIR